MFPRISVTNYQKLSGLNNSNLFSPSSGSQESTIRVWVGLVPAAGSESKSVLCLSFSFWWLLAILCVPWPVDLLFHSLPPFLDFLLPCACLLSYYRGFCNGFRAHLIIQADLISRYLFLKDIYLLMFDVDIIFWIVSTQFHTDSRKNVFMSVQNLLAKYI